MILELSGLITGTVWLFLFVIMVGGTLSVALFLSISSFILSAVLLVVLRLVE